MSNMFKSPKPPTPAPPAVMPDPENPALIESKRRKAFEDLSKGGRTSTILTGKAMGGNGSAFDTFVSTKLGAG
jgi:hypothetical protein